MQTENVNKFQGPSDDELRKLGQPKLAKAGWTVLVANGGRMRDASTGRWGINISYSPASGMDGDVKIKKNVRVYNTLWAWFKDPTDKKRKPADSFGLFEQFVRTHGVTMPSDGSSCPKLATRDKATGKLVDGEGKPIDKLGADKLRLDYNRWISQLYRELWEACEKSEGDNPLKGYAVFAKIEHNESNGNTYANIKTFAAALPDDAVLVDPFAKGDEDEDGEEDENEEN